MTNGQVCGQQSAEVRHSGMSLTIHSFIRVLFVFIKFRNIKVRWNLQLTVIAIRQENDKLDNTYSLHIITLLYKLNRDQDVKYIKSLLNLESLAFSYIIWRIYHDSEAIKYSKIFLFLWGLQDSWNRKLGYSYRHNTHLLHLYTRSMLDATKIF